MKVGDYVLLPDGLTARALQPLGHGKWEALTTTGKVITISEDISNHRKIDQSYAARCAGRDGTESNQR